MTEKYARMDNLIPPLKESPLIDDIVTIESRWMESLAEQYPLSFRGNARGFSRYLTAELETYSDATLEHYHRDVRKAEDDGRNLARERYLTLFTALGFESLDAVEENARKKQGL
jgi:hypothetical protein